MRMNMLKRHYMGIICNASDLINRIIFNSHIDAYYLDYVPSNCQSHLVHSWLDVRTTPLDIGLLEDAYFSIQHQFMINCIC